MQSVLSITRSSLTSQRGRMFPKPTQIILAQRHHYRQPSLISNRAGQSPKSLWTRRFSSEKAGTNGNSSSTKEHATRGSFFSIFEWYSKKLDTHPILTKCITGGFISSIGSVLAQVIEHQQEQQQHEKNNSNKKSQQQPFQVDIVQVSRFAFLNVIFVAPVLHHWYNVINRAIPGTSFPRVLQRTFADEFLFSPIYVPAFLSMLWKLEGSSNEDIWKMLKSECPSIIVTEWAMWIPTMIITFRYVPVKFQVMVVNLVGVVWNTFLAYAANNAHFTPPEIENNGDKEEVQQS